MPFVPYVPANLTPFPVTFPYPLQRGIPLWLLRHSRHPWLVRRPLPPRNRYGIKATHQAAFRRHLVQFSLCSVLRNQPNPLASHSLLHKALHSRRRIPACINPPLYEDLRRAFSIILLDIWSTQGIMMLQLILSDPTSPDPSRPTETSIVTWFLTSHLF